LLLLPACYAQRSFHGGGQTKFSAPRRIEPADIILPPGYRIEAVARNFTFPTGVAFDDQGRPYVTEAGYSYGELFTTPRLLRIEPDGSTTVIAAGSKDFAPWTGLVFHNGAFYVAEGGEVSGGRISRIDLNGTITPLIDSLPSMGDHHTNGPAIGPDGRLYFGVGTATNSGVVGLDNYEYGWLKRHRQFHDIPGQDIELIGHNFTSDDPITDAKGAKAVTGAYSPFGTPTVPGQIIRGQVPCSGSILRISLQGGPAELVAWGFRNPFGLAFAPDGQLYVTENQFDVRGSRPVWGTGDLLWKVKPGLWYGWPDFYSGLPLDRGKGFKAPGHDAPPRLLAKVPNEPPRATAKFGVHSSSCGFDFSRSNSFGYVGEAFVAQFGDMAPNVGKVLAPVGYKIVRVNVSNGVILDFAINRGKTNGPASDLKTGGLERPVAARFDPTGQVLYVIDFGVLTTKDEKSFPQPETGVLWRISREAHP
jgi:glucose/arabinose dehydrogenase